jgi:glycosyltransferase involved in cell wall biosynthesis
MTPSSRPTVAGQYSPLYVSPCNTAFPTIAARMADASDSPRTYDAIGSGAERRPCVMHFMQRWLPLSEPFVYDVVTKGGYPRLVVSSQPVENLELFPFKPLVSLGRLPRPGRGQQQIVTAALMFLTWRYSVGVIHVHHGYRLHEVMGTRQRRRIPLVLSLHGHDITGSLETHPDRYVKAIPWIDAVIVPSRFLADIAEAAGFPAERIHVIPSGVDTAWFNPTPLPSGRPEVVFVGRFVEKKGLDVLVKAWPSVQRQVPDARLRILGFGPLESLAHSAGDAVEVVLSPNREQVRDAIRDSYVVVSPSRTAPDDSVESLLVVNLEAQASGRPVVTTRHGGIPEFVSDGETALVVPESDPNALADALTTVLRDPALAKRLGAAGPRWVQQFDAARCAARVDAVYDALLAH